MTKSRKKKVEIKREEEYEVLVVAKFDAGTYAFILWIA